MRPIRHLLICSLFILTLTQFARAQNWPQWRGVNRDGVATSVRLPASFPERLTQRWKVEVGSGHASPVVIGQRVYLHAREGEEEVIASFNLETGARLWQDRYVAPYTVDQAAAAHGKGPKSTPVFAQGRLYTLGITGILSCYQATSGRLLWRKEFSQRFRKQSPDYGTATSPLVDSGLVIAFVGGKDSGALLAFDAATGKERWSWSADGPGYSSPIVVELGGVRQLVTPSQQKIISLAITSGKLLWQIPFKTEWDNSIITPVLYRDTLIFSGDTKGTFAIRPINRAGQWTTERVWHTDEVELYMNTPVLRGDYLYGLSTKRKGQFFCVDARTGKTMWLTEGREGDNAAMIAVDSLLFLLTDDAEMTIARVNPQRFEVVKKFTVASSPTWAHPVILNDALLIKDAASLTLWKLK